MFTEESNRSFINHLLAEHRRLHRMLTLASRTLEVDSQTWRDNFVSILTNIRQELAGHFAEEERGGCLDEAVSFRPLLSPDLVRVEQEHPRLLAAIDGLLTQAKETPNIATDRTALMSTFARLCRVLHAHEAAENDILRRGFGVDVNGEVNGAAAHV